MVEWDEAKRRSNWANHGVDFAAEARFDWTQATIEADLRRDYGEARFVAVGPLDGRLYVLIFTLRGRERRVISLRKANSRERRKWDVSRRSS